MKAFAAPSGEFEETPMFRFLSISFLTAFTFAAASASAEHTDAVSARGVEERLVLAAGDFAIEIREGDAIDGRGRGQPGGHQSAPRAAGFAPAAIGATPPRSSPANRVRPRR